VPSFLTLKYFTCDDKCRGSAGIVSLTCVLDSLLGWTKLDVTDRNLKRTFQHRRVEKFLPKILRRARLVSRRSWLDDDKR